MSRDDMHVVMAKILAYLYACMKAGKEPDPARIRHDSDMIGINRRYHANIMRELVDLGFVTGISFMECWEEECDIIVYEDPSVTVAGIEFMYDNGSMGRAITFLRKNTEGLPTAVATLLAGMLI